MEEEIKRLIEDAWLTSDADISLGSIAWLEEQKSGFSSARVLEDLRKITIIVRKYSEHVEALKILDRAMGVFYQRKKDGRHVGSLDALYKKEDRISRQRGPLTIGGLTSRIEEALLGIEDDGVRREVRKTLAPRTIVRGGHTEYAHLSI